MSSYDTPQAKVIESMLYIQPDGTEVQLLRYRSNQAPFRYPYSVERIVNGKMVSGSFCLTEEQSCMLFKFESW